MKIKKQTILVTAWAVTTLCLMSGVAVKASSGDPYVDLVLSVVGTFGAPTSLSSDPTVAAPLVLGAPDASPPTAKFIQISDGSSITLVFVDNVALSDGSTSGADLRIYTYDLPYPGAATIEVSLDGITFLALNAPPLNDPVRTCLGDNSQFCNYDDNLAGYIDFDFDAVGLPFVTHVRITDLPGSIDGEYSYPSLGFDLDAIQALNPGECVTPPSGLVSWWPGDGNAYDIIDGNDGTPQNGATFGTGKVDLAFFFDGEGDYVEINDNSNLHIQELTIDAWVLFGGTPSNLQYFLRKWLSDDGGWGSFAGFRRDDNRVAFTVQNSKLGMYPGWSSTEPLTPGWHHVAFTWTPLGNFDANDGKLYIDGNEISTIFTPHSYGGGFSIEYMNLPLFFGKSPQTIWAEDYEGGIDEVEIFGRALSDSEIKDIFNAGGTGKCKAIQVAIDIKPGSYPNSINLGSHGSIPVAILSSEEFDATSVDPDTIELAGSSVAVRGKGNKYMAHEEDVNGDGRIDLVVQIETEILNPEFFQNGYAFLTGETSDGRLIEGSDEITIVPKE